MSVSPRGGVYLRVMVHWYHLGIYLSIERYSGEGKGNIEVSVGYNQLIRSQKAQFYCPQSGGVCEILYFVDGKVGSQKALRLVTPRERKTREERNDEKVFELERQLRGSGRSPALKGAARRKAIERLSNLDLERYPELREIIQEEWEAPSRQLPKARDSTPTSTVVALSKALLTLPYVPDERVLERMSASRAGFKRVAALTGPDPGLGHHGSKQPLDDHPRLDIRILVEREYVEADKIDAGHLLWQDCSNETGMISFLVDTTDQQLPFLALRMDDRPGQPEQVIRLRRPADGKRKRWYFLRPVTAEPKEVLAYRNGRFASAEAQSLVYCSKMERSKAAKRNGLSSDEV